MNRWRVAALWPTPKMRMPMMESLLFQPPIYYLSCHWTWTPASEWLRFVFLVWWRSTGAWELLLRSIYFYPTHDPMPISSFSSAEYRRHVVCNWQRVDNDGPGANVDRNVVLSMAMRPCFCCAPAPTEPVMKFCCWLNRICWPVATCTWWQNHTSLGGGDVNAFSIVICDASFTSSKSITFFFAWFAYILASSKMHVMYPAVNANRKLKSVSFQLNYTMLSMRLVGVCVCK